MSPRSLLITYAALLVVMVVLLWSVVQDTNVDSGMQYLVYVWAWNLALASALVGSFSVLMLEGASKTKTKQAGLLILVSAVPSIPLLLIGQLLSGDPAVGIQIVAFFAIFLITILGGGELVSLARKRASVDGDRN
ncbi:MAG: hypothetical protein EAX95_00960 [Candidatus Thorarchaeota archaeon]|nr:hypothetical protein [Candidatus Thorarchaeota archaeon]